MSHYREDYFLPVQRIAFALNKARNLFTAVTDAALAGTGLSGSHRCALLSGTNPHSRSLR